MLYYNPKTIDEAAELLNSLDNKNIVILAGGTDVVPKFNSRPEKSGYFDKSAMDLDNCNIVYFGDAGLKYIEEKNGKIIIGAMTTMTEILESSLVDKVPVIKEAAKSMAGLTIRNTATIGGNIMNASPAADSVPPLIALGAQVVLYSVDGERCLAIDEFFENPGKTKAKGHEFLKEVRIPLKTGNASFIKFGRRKAESLSVVNGASYIEMDGNVCSNAIIALGAVAPTPVRAKKAEAALIGKNLTAETIEAAAEIAIGEIDPIDDKRASGEYRKKLVKVLVKRAVTNACQ